MANDINKLFVNVQGKEAAGKYASTYIGDDRDTSRDNQIAFLTSYGTIATHGNILTGGLKADITVEGGPLADDSVDNWPGDWKRGDERYIPANTDLQTLIEKLFLQEVDGSLGNPVYVCNPSIKDPAKDIKIGSTSVINNSYPLGTQVVVSFNGNDGLNNTNATATVTPTISKGTAGYYGTDNKWHSGNYVQTITVTPTGSLSTVGTWNGTAVSTNDTVTITNVGDNTLSVTSSGKTYSVGTFATDTIYGATNTKKKLSDVSKTIVADGNGVVNKTDATLGANTKTCKVTGYKPIFYGQLTQTNKAKSSWTVEEMTSGTSTSTVPSGAKQITVQTGTGTVFVAMPSDNAKASKKFYMCKSADKAPYGGCLPADAGVVTYTHPNTTTTTTYKIFFITTQDGWGDPSEMDIEWQNV